MINTSHTSTSHQQTEDRFDSRKRGAAQVSRLDCAQVRTVTMNGYEIVRCCDLEGKPEDQPGRYRFIVLTPEGDEQEVLMTIQPDIMTALERQRGTRPALHAEFWINCAEHRLATYLWERDQLPLGGSLGLEELSVDELDHARRWGIDW